jgi:hypothetical protein
VVNSEDAVDDAELATCSFSAEVEGLMEGLGRAKFSRLQTHNNRAPLINAPSLKYDGILPKD